MIKRATSVVVCPLEANDYGNDFEAAIADVQLFGTEAQVRMAKDLATAIAKHDKNASTGPLLLSLRDALREELDLGVINECPIHFRLKTENKSGSHAP